MSTKKQTLPLTPRTDEQKYIIADAIAISCNKLSPENITNYRNYYFRQIINSYIVIEGVQTTVVEAFVEEDAMHITRLALNRIQAGSILNKVPVLTFDDVNTVTEEEK